MNSNYLKSLRIVYFAMAMGLVLFLIVTLFLINLNGPLAENDISPTQRAPFIIVLVLLTGALFMVYRAIFPRKTEAIQSLLSLDKKMEAWRELRVLQAALIEAPAFFALVLFLLLGVNFLLVWPIVGLMLFWYTQPTREKFLFEAKLSISETEEFDRLV